MPQQMEMNEACAMQQFSIMPTHQGCAVHLSWHFLLPSLDFFPSHILACLPLHSLETFSFRFIFFFASLHICIIHCVVSGLGDCFLSIYLFLIS
jgi:hypothetical protein